MDAESLQIILDNTRPWNEAAQKACVTALEKAEALPGMRNYPGQKEGYDLAQKIGEAVKDMIWQYARREHRITEGTSSRTLTGEIFATALGHISDADLGAAYYPHVRERWCYANGIDPYPA